MDRLWIWVERGLLAGGLTLLVVFASFRLGQAHDRSAGVDAFNAAYPAAPGIADAVELPASPIEAGAELPDQSLWSEARIRAYEESLAVVEDLPLAVLRLDRLDIEVPVYNGTEHPVLDRGAGRIRGTAWIDEPGNLGIAAHRDGFFRPLKDVETGDLLHLETPTGIREYRVESTQIVTPDDVSVLAPTDEPVITLVTCYPFYFVGDAPERFIVTARASDVSTNAINEGTP